MTTPERVIMVTKGESSFIARALTILRSDIKQDIKEHGDEDGVLDAHIRILNAVIPRFEIDKKTAYKILDVLNELFENADEDCPQENRTEHFRTAMSEAEEILIKYGIRVNRT